MSEVVLNDVCELIVDCPHSTAYDEGTGYPLVRTPNIGRGRIIYSGMHRVCEEVYNKRNARAIPQTNDLIFAREATAGNVALIQEGEKVCLGQRTVLIRPNANLVNPAFLTYHLLAPEQQYKLLSTANGATVAHVNMPTIRNLKLSLPPLATQHRIATILSRYDSLIENYQKQIKLLEEAAQRLYKEWFIDLRFPGHENTKIVDGVPEGWEIKSITNNHLFDVAKCRIALFNGNKTYYATADVEGTYFCNSGVKIEYDNKPSRAQIQPSLYSVWFARMSNSFKIVGFVEQNNNRREDSILSSGFAGFESHYERFGFLYCLISSQWFNDQKDRYATGATQVSITNEGLSRIRCLLPTTRLAEEFSLVTNKIIEETILYRENCTMLTEARDRLLPKLMSGEIEI